MSFGGSIPIPIPKLPPALQAQVDALNAAMTGEEICGPICAGIAAGIVEAINISEWLVTVFQGVPRTQKTIQTGQRLLQSQVAAVQMLGLWWYKAGGANIIDSNAPDITTYFQPAFNYTIATLNIPFASPAWYALSQVIGEGQPAVTFDTQYAQGNFAKPMFITRAAWNILHPDERYPDELVKVYTIYIPTFVNPQTPPPPPPPTGPQNGSTQQLDQQCCDAIVNAIIQARDAINMLPNENGLANGPGITVALQQISQQVSIITQSFSTLAGSLGGSTTDLFKVLYNIANFLSQTTIDVGGQEVAAINAASSAIYNVLNSIDVNDVNSFAGITRAIAAIPPVDLSQVVEELKCLCAPLPPVRPFLQALIDQGLLDSDITSRTMAALPQTVE
jgi:hypothetical protein